MRHALLVCLMIASLIGCAASEGDRIRSKIDAIAEQTQRAAESIRDAASGAAAIGVPGAGIVALVAGAVGTIAGLFNERRRRTTPLRHAIGQVVRSVDAAFPEKTSAQKAALASAQDSLTQGMVREIRRSAATRSQRRNET